MIDSGWADHTMGLELQIEELVRRRKQLGANDPEERFHDLEVEITALQLELADSFERLGARAGRAHIRGLTAKQLTNPEAA